MADTGASSRPRILVVDDDPALGSLLAEALEADSQVFAVSLPKVQSP